MSKNLSGDTYWIELGFLPVGVGYVPTRKAWAPTLQRLKINPDTMPWPDTDGRCTHWTDTSSGKKELILITLTEQAHQFSVSQIAGLIAHECQHAWQIIRSEIGEDQPSSEFEAYVIQALVQGCMYAHSTKRRVPWKATK